MLNPLGAVHLTCSHKYTHTHSLHVEIAGIKTSKSISNNSDANAQPQKNFSQRKIFLIQRAMLESGLESMSEKERKKERNE